MLTQFSDRIQLKAVATSVIAYLVVSVLATAILVQMWLPAGVSAEEAARLAETASFVITGELIIGAVLGIAAGWLACHISGGGGLKNSLIVGITFVLFAVLSIAMHPAAPLWKHILHLVAPVPISLFGGYLRLRSKRLAGPSHA